MKILFLVFSWCSTVLFFPPGDIWNVLDQVAYKVYFDKKLDDVVLVPIPSKSTKNLESQSSITIEGFKTTSLDKEFDHKNTIVLSRYDEQFQSCTNLLIEDCIQVFQTKKYQLKAGKSYTFKGCFHLNTQNQNEFPFQLKEAQCLNCQ
ncbi:MAG: hypothetical protein ACRBFS_09745 [Aureispira sp.]